ncbi:hypothetical protein TheveDRAFT_0460 [Thermanaerovibrio velox DSM 12556]|uniref:Uncharacterized protein n=1 Tax=Thermanaerovibrio velox DSM 12556 TaxID=926567 RepID=H0UPZ5_9BACT|nr:hypothetical protein [Thermanaerovibrio velox]EHM09624.1 hypothetical protein TheveDRAFT_0460 [Thermanaerovibrio velox DSM 12556]
MESIEGLVRVLNRLFLGRVRVRSWGGSQGCEVLSLRADRGVLVKSMGLVPRVVEASFVRWGRMRVGTPGRWLFDPKAVVVAGGLEGYDAVVKAVPFRLRGRVERGLERVIDLPQERANRVRYFPLEIKGASVMAVFYPIIKGLVKRSVLDKRSGRLLLWYRDGVSSERPARLLMVRVFGAEDPVRWIWL